MNIDNRVRFEDLTMEDKFVSCKVKFSIFTPRRREAQQWLDRQIIMDMKPLTPYRTGNFRGHWSAVNNAKIGTGQLVATLMPYGKYLYHGVTRGGNPTHYTNPKTTPYWFNTAKLMHEKEWRAGVERIIKGGK